MKVETLCETESTMAGFDVRCSFTCAECGKATPMSGKSSRRMRTRRCDQSSGQSSGRERQSGSFALSDLSSSALPATTYQGSADSR
jgi:hypothetical protein